MNAYEIAEKFRVAFAGDVVFAGVGCRVDQSSAAVVRPALIFGASVQPLNLSGSALRYRLQITVESPAEKRTPADPEPAAAHSARVEAVRAKVFGDGKDALQAAVNAAAGYDFRGWSPGDGEIGIEDGHFRTPVVLMGTVLVG